MIIATGCTNMMNTPTKRVEEFLGKYQTMHEDVLSDLNDVVDNTTEYSDEGKKEFKSLMQKQYQNLSYKIKNETVDGDKATVEVEIEVFDYHTSLEKTDLYIRQHPEEFLDDNDKTSQQKQEEYRIKQLKSVTDKEYYTITFNLTKNNDIWTLEPISNTDLQKIHGLYQTI